MVFQDYELIHTKRVNRQRRNMDILQHRKFVAFGQWSPFYFAATAGTLACHFFGLSASQLIPTRAFLTKTGFLSYMSVAGLKFLLPVVVGLRVGIAVFGDYAELQKLRKNSSFYGKELKDYQREIYDF